jgi:hypothetical protein
MNRSISLDHAASDSWVGIKTVRVGRIPERLPSPDLYAMVLQGDEPLLNIEIYKSPNEYSAFKAAALWKGFAAIGFGERLYLVNLDSQQVLEFSLDGYFGQLQVNDNQLLVASAQNVIALDPSGAKLWQSAELGIDGVVLHEANANEIRGSGEWDPPGGWKEFRLSASTGRVLQPDA